MLRTICCCQNLQGSSSTVWYVLRFCKYFENLIAFEAETLNNFECKMPNIEDNKVIRKVSQMIVQLFRVCIEFVYWI
jgi:hypothetical protein